MVGDLLAHGWEGVEPCTHCGMSKTDPIHVNDPQASVAAILFGAVDDETFDRVMAALATPPSGGPLDAALEAIDRLIMGEENVARETGRPLDASFRVAGMRAARDVVARLTEDAGAATPSGGPLILDADTVCACLDETGERKVRLYEQCQRCGAFMVAATPSGGPLREALEEVARRCEWADAHGEGVDPLPLAEMARAALAATPSGGPLDVRKAAAAVVAEADRYRKDETTADCFPDSGPYCGAHSFLEYSPLIDTLRARLTEDAG